MSELLLQPFEHVGSSHASFNSSVIAVTATNFALQSTGVREWQLPTSRSVRVMAVSGASVPYYVRFGTSDTSVGSSNGIAIGTLPEIFHVSRSQTHVAVVSSTSLIVNVTLGHGKF